MSKENLDQFIQKATGSEELQARIGEEMDADSLIALGAEHGCEFTADDLMENADLSDEELDRVAGGVNASKNRLGVFQASGNGKFRIECKVLPAASRRDHDMFSNGTIEKFK